MKYVAFLRGINISGRKVLIQDLQQIFETMGFENIATLIASGNVIFDSKENNEQLLVKEIEEALRKQFGFSILVILRSKDEVKNLIAINPFVKLKVKQGVRFQITLFKEEINAKPVKQNGYEIVYIGKKDLGSVVYPEGKSTDLMTFMDKTFGKNSTTRNWNTIQKLGKI